MVTSLAVSRDQRGFALYSTFLLLLLLAAVGGASALYTVLDLKSTSHYSTGNQALFAAESGIQHALSSMNSMGVIHFQYDVADRWSTVFGVPLKTMPNDADVQYEVSVAADAADPVNAGSITATGYAPLQGRRTVTVRVRRNGRGKGIGAIHLAGDTVGTNFVGDSFSVSGNDHDQFGNLVAGGTSHPGISTRNDGVTNSVVGSLDDSQKDNIQGLGFALDPLTPSVLTTGGPSPADLNRMINDILAKPGVATDNTHVYNNGTTTVYGTVAAPQITHLTNTDVTVNGNITGAGILITDGSIDITGSIDFVGWIIVHGNTVIHTQTASDGTTVLGNAVVKGSLWTADFDVEVGGSAVLDYCDWCLTLAGGIGDGDNYPSAMEVRSWKEVL
jgi:cytoskeletal protein CcmA (bactofilin family)